MWDPLVCGSTRLPLAVLKRHTACPRDQGPSVSQAGWLPFSSLRTQFPGRHWVGGGSPQEGTQRPGHCKTPTYKLTHGMHNFVLNPPTHISSCSRQKYMNKIMRRCSNFSRKWGSLVCGLLAVEHQLSRAPGPSGRWEAGHCGR